MTRPLKEDFEFGYVRNTMLAVELLDAVTLERVRSGVEVRAEGLEAKPIVNSSGFFVWLKEGSTAVQRITVEPGTLPYEKAEVNAAGVTLPRTTIELQPRLDYAFLPGVTGLRGTLIERPDPNPVPVIDGEVWLRWKDDLGVWDDAPARSRTDAHSGDFVSFLRLRPDQKPDVDANGNVTVQLHVRRGNFIRKSTDLQLRQGCITDPTKAKPMTFAWSQLQP